MAIFIEINLLFVPDTTNQINVCGSDIVNTTVFPDTKLQTLDSRVGKDQLFFDRNMFEQSVNDWTGIPVIFQKDGIHPTNFAAVADNPAQASAAINGRLVGSVSNPRIVIPGGPRLMAELDIREDEREIVELWQQGKLFPSTAFSAVSDGDKIVTPPVPNHVLLFPVELDRVQPGDPGAFVNTLEVPQSMTKNTLEKEPADIRKQSELLPPEIPAGNEPGSSALAAIRAELEALRSEIDVIRSLMDKKQKEADMNELQKKDEEIGQLNAEITALKTELNTVRKTAADAEFSTLLDKLPVGMTATTDQVNSLRKLYDAGDMKQLLFTVLGHTIGGTTAPIGMPFTHSTPVEHQESVGDLSAPWRG